MLFGFVDSDRITCADVSEKLTCGEKVVKSYCYVFVSRFVVVAGERSASQSQQSLKRLVSDGG